MKILCLLSIVLVITSFTCCKKNEGRHDLSGTWHLVKLRGMFVVDSFPTDRQESITFNGDNYEFRVGDEVTSGTFTTLEDPGVEKEVCLKLDAGSYTRRIVFTGRSSDQKIFYEVDGDTFKTISGCFALDGGREKTYKRSIAN